MQLHYMESAKRLDHGRQRRLSGEEFAPANETAGVSNFNWGRADVE